MRARRTILVCASVLFGVCQPAPAEKPRSEYRVVFASARDLGRQLEAAGREGYACVAVARPDSGAAPPGVVVILSRVVGSPAAPVSHRVIAGGWASLDASLLDRAGGEGFRLCGVTLNEEPPNPAVVAILSRTAGPPVAARYAVEILKIYKESLVRLGAGGRDGFVPVAAAPVGDNRVPDMRSWLVVTERAGAAPAPQEIAVRSNSLPGRFQEALNESGGQGYRVNLVWKEGNDFVAMMSRPVGSKGSFAYVAEAMETSKVHWVKGLPLADLPHRGDERVVVSDPGAPASNDLEEDALPPVSRSGAVDAEALEVLGNHLTRHRGSEPVFARIRKGSNGTFVLATVVTQRSP